MSVWVIIPAAGRGDRLGAPAPKQFVSLSGIPMLARTVSVFDALSVVAHIVVVVPPGDEARCRATMIEPYGFSKVRAVVQGGTVRQESVSRGLDAIDRDASIVVVHDAARPLVTANLVRRVVEVAGTSGAAVAALRVVDTLKRRTEGDGMVVTVDRENLWMAQTPQAFRVDLFRKAVAQATADRFLGTDDASLVERLGIPVSLVDGEPFNFKITRPQDVHVAEELLAANRDRSTPASASAGDPSGRA